LAAINWTFSALLNPILGGNLLDLNGFSGFNNDDYFELIFPTIDYEPHYSP
tara:strand:+ start:94 stop:246 length:153 start_codon:yes stop_codon:yes gene_type:complete